jgi:hypothetical protein
MAISALWLGHKRPQFFRIAGNLASHPTVDDLPLKFYHGLRSFDMQIVKNQRQHRSWGWQHVIEELCGWMVLG